MLQTTDSSVVPWDQVILACVEHMLSTIPSNLMAGIFMNPTAHVFHPPFEWQRAVAETTLALSSCGQQRERPRNTGGSKRRKRSESIAVHEPVAVRSRPGMDTSRGFHLDKKLAKEGRQLIASLNNEVSRSKRYS